MSPTYWEREASSRDIVRVAYLLVVLGIGLFMIGIGLLISGDNVFQRCAPFMNLGIAMFVIGLAVLVLRSALLSVFLSDKHETRRPKRGIVTLGWIVLSLLMLFVLYIGVILFFAPTEFFLPWAYLVYLIFAVVVIVFGMLPRSTD